jgi:membrane protein
MQTEGTHGGGNGQRGGPNGHWQPGPRELRTGVHVDGGGLGQSPDSHRPPDELGRSADAPREIPRRGWWQILRRTASEISRDNVSLVAAGVAFYTLLAIPPALAAAIALWGFVASPAELQSQIGQLASVLPADAAATFREQLEGVAARSADTLGWTAVIGLLLSLWSARLAVNAMIGALNIVYEETERRGFLKLSALSVAFTVAAMIGGLLALVLVAGVPAVLELLGLSVAAEVIVQLLRWAVLLALIVVALSVLYRFGPSRHQARWRWVSWGAGVATVLWIAGSAAFSLFVANFGSYGETYGAIAGVVVLLMWLWLSAFAALVGAELNSEMEHQTARDTTTGGSRPLGDRGAWVADHVARH